MKTKNLINDGGKAVDEMLDGIVAARPRHLSVVAASRRSIIARNGPRRGKVGLVSGCGSGHEPNRCLGPRGSRSRCRFRSRQ